MIRKTIILSASNGMSDIPYWRRVFMDIFHYYLNVRDWIINLIKQRKLLKRLKQISLKVAKKYGINDRDSIKELLIGAEKAFNALRAKNKYDTETVFALIEADAECSIIRGIFN